MDGKRKFRERFRNELAAIEANVRCLERRLGEEDFIAMAAYIRSLTEGVAELKELIDVKAADQAVWEAKEKVRLEVIGVDPTDDSGVMATSFRQKDS